MTSVTVLSVDAAQVTSALDGLSPVATGFPGTVGGWVSTASVKRMKCCRGLPLILVKSPPTDRCPLAADRIHTPSWLFTLTAQGSTRPVVGEIAAMCEAGRPLYVVK